MKYIKPADNKDIQIRVVIMPDMKDDKPVITTNITIFDKRIKAGEVSSKDMSELDFRRKTECYQLILESILVLQVFLYI